MIPELKDLLSKTVADDLDTRQEAILEVALLIEKHSPRRDSDAYYESMLPPELLNIRLSEGEQIELVHEVGQIVLSDAMTGSLVWALTKSTSLEALEYLLTFLCRERLPKDQYAIWQALIGIHVFLSVDAEHHLRDQIFGLARKSNLKQTLKRIEEAGADEQVKQTVHRVRERLAT